MSKSSYSFYQYAFIDAFDEQLPWERHAKIIRGAATQKVPHRVANPEPHDHNTFIMRVRAQTILDWKCVIFDIAKSIDFRTEHRYDASADDIDLVDVRANDTHWTHVVMLPECGRVAVRDGSGERLPADQGVNRIGSVLKHLNNIDFQYERTATASDIAKAAERLKLTEFTFTARPFNPHPHVLGEQLHAILEAAKVGRIVAKAEPKYGQSMSAAEGGLVSEAMGLAQVGYAQYGFRGRTKSGVEVAYKKPK